MKIEVRYRHEEDASGVYMTHVKGASPADVGQMVVDGLGGDGVHHSSPGDHGDQFKGWDHSFQVVYDHDEPAFYVEIVAHEEAKSDG